MIKGRSICLKETVKTVKQARSSMISLVATFTPILAFLFV